jgi:hypothetical protein
MNDQERAGCVNDIARSRFELPRIPMHAPMAVLMITSTSLRLILLSSRSIRV